MAWSGGTWGAWEVGSRVPLVIDGWWVGWWRSFESPTGYWDERPESRKDSGNHGRSSGGAKLLKEKPLLVSFTISTRARGVDCDHDEKNDNFLLAMTTWTAVCSRLLLGGLNWGRRNLAELVDYIVGAKFFWHMYGVLICVDLATLKRWWENNLQAKSEAENSSSFGQESAHVHKLCYDACPMFARSRGVTRNTARSGCKEMPGSLPLPMWHNLREPAALSTTSLLSEQWQPSTQRWPVEVTVIFQRGSYILCLAIKSPSNTIYS